MPTRDNTGVSGVIHDIGYQHYDGPRLGRGYAARALYVHSVRSAFGLGRSAWAKVLPIGLLAIVSIAALVLVVVNTQLPVEVIDYVGIASTFTYAATVFVAVVAPELVSVDLRSNLLQLYLSRPLRRANYALTKLAALATATFLLFAIPMLILFLGMAFSTDDGIGGVFSELGGLFVGLLSAAIHAALLAAFALPIASLSGRRVFATGMIIGVFLLMAPVSAAIRAFDSRGAGGQLAVPWLTVRQNIVLPLKEKGVGKAERERLTDEALVAVGLADSQDSYPWQLSGGMQQRVAIARAVAYEPHILIMDEPFAAVDAQTRTELEDLVRELWKRLGVTVVFVTHDIDEAVYLGQRVLVLSNRPTVIMEDVVIDLPDERSQIETRADPTFVAHRTHVYELIQQAKRSVPRRPSNNPSRTVRI